MKFFIITLGCKVNQYESESMHKNMLDAGFDVSFNSSDADIVIVNSCTVTSTSDSKVRKIMNRIKRENPNSILVLTGCMPQAFPTREDIFQYADIVLGNSNRSKLVPYINKFIAKRSKIIKIIDHNSYDKFENIKVENFHERTRAFLKIEDGCNRFCSYCIIPYARGRVRSKSMDDIKEEVSQIALNGYKEIVLVGINLSAYGKDISSNLCDAVDLVSSIEGIERVRLSSLEPDLIDDYSLERLANNDKFCPHFHLSLQSGCDETLKRMNRHYTTDQYFSLCEMIRKRFNNPSITTDVMVGFPGETDLEFETSMEFVKKVGFAKAHVFPYSIRPGTRAANFDNQITNMEKKARSRRMITVTDKTRNDFLKTQIGKKETVLFETTNEDNVYEGYTKNYTPVKVKSLDNIIGKTKKVEILEVKEDSCIANIVN